MNRDREDIRGLIVRIDAATERLLGSEKSQRVVAAMRVLYEELPPGAAILARAIRLPRTSILNQSGRQEQATVEGHVFVMSPIAQRGIQLVLEGDMKG